MIRSSQTSLRSQADGPGRRAAAKLWSMVALLAVMLLIAGAFNVAAAAPKFPELAGRVTDNANLLSPEDKAAIEADLAALETKSTDQIAVVTVPSLEGYTIEDYGYQLGRHWGIGQAGKDNGALLIVAPNERKVRIEVGRRLEPLLTDTMSAIIIQNAILPRFRRGDFSGGIRAGVTDMKDVLLGDGEAVKDRAKGGRSQSDVDWVALAIFAIWIAIFIYVMYAQYRYAQSNPGTRYRRRGRDGGVIVIPGDSGHWESDWGGGSSGGGWSGGGGGFGGGGASGSW